MSTQGHGQRIFITGGSGYIGNLAAKFAIAEGYEVHGLSRSESSDAKLTAIGAVPIRGELTSLDVIRRESAEAQAVLHLAYNMTPDYDWEGSLKIDNAAVEAIADALQGTGKAFVASTGTLVVEPDPTGAETTEDAPLAKNPLNNRREAELHYLSLAARGIRVSVIRLAPYVYGRGGSGIRMAMNIYSKMGSAFYVGEGKVRTTGVYVDDAARLYLLAMRGAKPGDVFNGASSTDVTTREMAEAIAEILGIPAVSLTAGELEAKLGTFIARFVNAENRASGAKAVRELGWKPEGPGMLDDIRTGSYKAVAEEMLKGASA